MVNYPDQYLNLFTPPPVAITYWHGDLVYLENEIKKYEFEKNTSNSISTSNRLLDLSLIHISEPTRPY